MPTWTNPDHSCLAAGVTQNDPDLEILESKQAASKHSQGRSVTTDERWWVRNLTVPTAAILN